MATVVADITMSLDGFVTARGADREHGLGIGGEPLHDWAFRARAESPLDAEVLDGAFAATGAVVMGRRTFDVVDGPQGWGDDVGYGYDQNQSQAPPVFVVTHEPPERTRLTSGFTFVTSGVQQAVERARATAGDRKTFLMGGASVIQQALRADLVDEIQIHLAPLLLWSGTRLFDDQGDGLTRLEQLRTVETPFATHLFYRVVGEGRGGDQEPARDLPQ